MVADLRRRVLYALHNNELPPCNALLKSRREILLLFSFLLNQTHIRIIIVARSDSMSYDREIAILIQRYFKEEKRRDISIDEILKRPRWKRVYYFWKALEKYEGKPMNNMSLDTIKSIYGD